MHRCLKCGRTISDVREINDGCSCGSKVFVFIKAEAEPEAERPLRHSAMSMMDFNKHGVRPVEKGSPSNQDGSEADGENVPNDEKSDAGNPPTPKMPEIISEPSSPELVPEEKEDGSRASSLPIENKKNVQAAPSEAAPSHTSGTVADAITSPRPVTQDSTIQELKLAKGAKITQVDDGGEIENVRQLSKGVYEVDVGSLTNGPVVMMDDQGIYYVRLPFTQNALKPKEKN